jgi:hypothetical protein
MDWNLSDSAYRKHLDESPFNFFIGCIAVCAAVGIFVYAVMRMFGWGLA